MSFLPLSVLTGIKDRDECYNEALGAAPLIHRFQTNDHFYAYDVNTGAILELTPLTYALLDFFPLTTDESDLEEISSALGSRWTTHEIELGVRQLNKLTLELNIFRPIAIKSRMFSPDLVRRRLNDITGHLGQLVLSVAEQCNLRCNYCAYSGGYVNIREHNNSMMSWDVAKRAIDFFLARIRPAKGELTFYGGEPLINFALIRQCIEHMQERDSDVTFGLTTNGTLLTDEIIDFLAKYNVRALISLDGPEELHDKERRFIGGQGSFHRVIDNARKIHSRHPDYFVRRVKFWCTLRPDDDDEAAVRFFVNNHNLFRGNVGFGQIASGHADYASYPTNTKASTSRLEQQYLEKVVSGDVTSPEFTVLREMFETPYIRLQYRPKSATGFGEDTHAMGACFPGNYRVFVKAEGTFQICEKSNDALVIGHIDRGFDAEKIVAIYQSFYDLHNKACRRCWAYRLCPSCYVSATRDTGRFESTLNPSFCNSVRSKWDSYLTNYCHVLERSSKGFSHTETLVADRIPVLDD